MRFAMLGVSLMMSMFSPGAGAGNDATAPAPAPAPATSETLAALDTYWAEVSRTVSEGDFAAYAAGYHPDAVLVAAERGQSSPIAAALERWEPGFTDAREGRARPSVTFRFAQRIHDATTAHETGIFRYASSSEEGAEPAQYMHFEALLVRRNGSWLTVMEYQKAMATEEEWNALR